MCVTRFRSTDYPNLSGSRLGEYALVDNRSYDDFHFTAEARSTDDLVDNPAADYDVVFGYQDENNYYYMMFNHVAANTELFKVVNGQRYTIATATQAGFFDNDYHTIEVTRSGALISAYRWAAPRSVTASDSTFGAGRLGIGSFNDAARFDDVTITTPDSGPGPGNVVIEAESMYLSNGYRVEGAPTASCCPMTYRGTPRRPLPDRAGFTTSKYSSSADRRDCQSWSSIRTRSASITCITSRRQRNRRLTIPGVSVSTGDFIPLAGFSENGGGARVDKISFVRK